MVKKWAWSEQRDQEKNKCSDREECHSDWPSDGMNRK